MTDADRILSEFMAAWEAGCGPDPDDYLARAPAAERARLSEQLRRYLVVAPEPPYSAQAWAAAAADPAAVRASALPLGEAEPWPALLPRLRAAAGLSVADVAGRLGVARPEKAAGYLEAMERGRHDPARVSRRALDALGRILGVPADALAWRGRGPAAAGAVLRAARAAPAGVDRLAALAELATTDADDWDDSDDLFLGGRDLA